MSTFLVDECVSSQTIELIKSLGFPVQSLQQFGKYGAKDEDILTLAQEKKFTLVTYDRGFGEITRYGSYAHSGIIIVKAHDSKSLRECHEVLEKLLRAETGFEETVFIVDRNKYRKRAK